MTIGKKLYMNFGIILTMVVVLFLVNLLAVQREHSAKAGAAASLKLTDNSNTERFQMMPVLSAGDGSKRHFFAASSAAVDSTGWPPTTRASFTVPFGDTVTSIFTVPVIFILRARSG